MTGASVAPLTDFNRTLLELKYYIMHAGVATRAIYTNFNRTLLELKLWINKSGCGAEK